VVADHAFKFQFLQCLANNSPADLILFAKVLLTGDLITWNPLSLLKLLSKNGYDY